MPAIRPAPSSTARPPSISTRFCHAPPSPGNHGQALGRRCDAQRELGQALILLAREEASRILLFGAGSLGTRSCSSVVRSCAPPGVKDEPGPTRRKQGRRASSGVRPVVRLAPPPASQEVEDLLLLRVAGNPYAIRLRDIAGMVAGRRVVPRPPVTLDLLGLAGIPRWRRSGVRTGVDPRLRTSPRLAPVDDPLRSGGPSPWPSSDFEGHLRLPKSSLHADENLRATRQYVNQVASTEAEARAVIGIHSSWPTIRNRIGHHGWQGAVTNGSFMDVLEEDRGWLRAVVRTPGGDRSDSVSSIDALSQTSYSWRARTLSWSASPACSAC